MADSIRHSQTGNARNIFCVGMLSSEVSGPGRRSKTRFPIALQIRYRTFGTPEFSGSGKTVNLSSQGIFIAAKGQHELSVGAGVEILADWPVLLDGTTPLQLKVLGRVVRSDTSGFAVSFTNKNTEFQITKKGPEAFTG